MPTIRIFIPSPGDVLKERDRAREVVEQLRRRDSAALAESLRCVPASEPKAGEKP